MAIIGQFGAANPYEDIKQGLVRTAASQVAARAQAMATGAPSKATPIARLQNALKAMGTTKGDPALSKLKVDGVVGPATTKAINHAIKQKYVVMASFPRPELTVQHVRQFAQGIADAVEGAVQAGGGTVPAIRKAAPASGGGGGGARAAASYVPPPPEAPEFNKKWIWWAVGGGSILLLLSVAASAAKKRRPLAVA